jgi:hypothetical protein
MTMLTVVGRCIRPVQRAHISLVVHLPWKGHGLGETSGDKVVTAVRAGAWPYRIITFYVGLMLAIFMVRTMKRVIFHEARQYRESLLFTGIFLMCGEARSTKECHPHSLCLPCAPLVCVALCVHYLPIC